MNVFDFTVIYEYEYALNYFHVQPKNRHLNPSTRTLISALTHSISCHTRSNNDCAAL